MFDDVRQAITRHTPISDSDWELMLPMLHVRSYGRGDHTLRAGEVERRLGYVRSGSLRWYSLTERGQQANFHFFFEDEFIAGYDSFLTQTPSKMFIEAMEPCEIVYLADREGIHTLYDRSHAWERVGRLVCERAYAFSARRVQAFMFLSAEERYLALIKERPDIFERVSLSHIASFLGIQPPSLSRIRARLVKP